MKKREGSPAGLPPFSIRNHIQSKDFHAESRSTQRNRPEKGLVFSAPSALTDLIWIGSDDLVQEAPVNSMPRRVTSSLIAEPRPKA